MGPSWSDGLVVPSVMRSDGDAFGIPDGRTDELDHLRLRGTTVKADRSARAGLGAYQPLTAPSRSARRPPATPQAGVGGLGARGGWQLVW